MSHCQAAQTSASPYELEAVVDKILEELKDVGDSLEEKWREIAQSLKIDVGNVTMSPHDNKINFRKVIMLWVEKCLGEHVWPGLVKALEKQITSNILKELRTKYCSKYPRESKQEGQGTTMGQTSLQHVLVDVFSQISHPHIIHVHVLMIAIFVMLTVSVGAYTHKMDPFERYIAENPLKAEQWLEVGRRTIRILVTGKTGTGKSTLINSIMGGELVPEGKNLTIGTKTVTSYQRLANGIPMVVYDSPGLQDGLENEDAYIQDMVDKCAKVDLILYTIKMSDARVHFGDKRAMGKLTNAFGIEFWNRTVFTLTFANQVMDPEVQADKYDFFKHEKYFQDRLDQWKEFLPQLLKTDFNIPENIADNVPIAPAGYHIKDLPGMRYWFGSFWTTALKRMKESGSDSYTFMLHYNKDRLQPTRESTDEDFEKEGYQQPIFWFWPF